jgi:Co/Zn/Cd efflux system component
VSRHTHNHHHVHAHEVVPQKNYKLYFKVSHIGMLLVALSGMLMYLADSHAAFGDWLHGVADVATIYLMAYLAKECSAGRISPRRFDRLAGFFNTCFLFASSAGICVETFMANHETTFFGMIGTGVVMFFGSWYQHRVMHQAHGHEKHEATGMSGWKSIDQHFLVDMFMAGCVIGVALWKELGLPGGAHADIYSALGEALVVFLLGIRNIVDMRGGKAVHV